MDIHRCRFVPYQPSAINALAFSHPKVKSAKHGSVARLAIGRANGDIEIWNPASGTWHQELIIRGGKDRSIDGLVWVDELDQNLGDGRIMIGRSRLFSIGYTSTVTEWDLVKGKPKRHASGQHGDIWCLAAQPSTTADGPSQEPQGPNKLVAGTMDGELVMYSLEDNDLRLQRVLVRSPTKKAQMVSITFQTRKVVIVGCSDSTIRAYDIAKGHLLRRMTLGSDLVGGAKDIIVWSVKCLPNGNIVSGDSTGQICIWDGKTYTQSQRIQGHKQDVLSLATSADGTAIMSGGMDRRTYLYKQNAGSGQRWNKVWGRRYHEHDVKAMASFEQGRTNVVVSGGPDANLVVVPLKEMGRENHRMISNLPQHPPLASARNARFIVSWWDRQVHIWAIRKSARGLFEEGKNGVDMSQNRKLLKTILIKGDSNIASATINQDGTLLVVSTATEVKAFQLRHKDAAKPSDLALDTLDLPAKLAKLGASQVQLSPDGKWLCLVQDGTRVLMIGIRSAKHAGGLRISATVPQRLRRLRRQVPRHILNGGLGGYERNVRHIAFSADSQMVAVADLAGYIDTWLLRGSLEKESSEEEEESAEEPSSSDSDDGGDLDELEAVGENQLWIRNPKAKLLPKLPSTPMVLSFSDTLPGAEAGQGQRNGASDAIDDYVLAVVTSSWAVMAFYPRSGALTAWSRRHPRKALPEAVQNLLDLPKGVLWQESRMWIYGVAYVLMLDLGQDLPEKAAKGEGAPGRRGTKRKRGGMTTGAGSQMDGDSLGPQWIRKHGMKGEGAAEVTLGGEVSLEGNESDDEMADADGELLHLRSNGKRSEDGPEAKGSVEEGKAWWITFKYRPILGMVPLGLGGQELEVALVERPIWDVEMPTRYMGDNEWDP